MGLLDTLINVGKKALTDTATKEIVRGVNNLADNYEKAKNGVSQGLDRDTFGKEAASYNRASTSSDSGVGENNVSVSGSVGRGKIDRRSFDEKLKEIAAQLGINISTAGVHPDELEREFGQSIYARGGVYAPPEIIPYKLETGGGKILYIRIWKDYNRYDRAANRQIKKFCDKNSVNMLDFFDYLPNDYDYMAQRIQAALG